MKRNLFRIISLGLVLAFVLSFTPGLNTIEAAESEVILDDTIVINSEAQGEVEFTIEDLMEFEEVTEEITRRDDGEVTERYPVTGVLLTDVLASMDIELSALESVRINAGDGYSVEVPNAILESPVILAYKIDGEPLFDDTRPIRVFIPGQEAMYWVKNTVEISLSGETVQEEESVLQEIRFMETVFAGLEKVDYQGNDGSEAIRTAALMSDISQESDLKMLATDGFEKQETYDTFVDAFIVTAGENTPAFRSPDLPRGMHVRDLYWLDNGTTGFFSVERGSEILGSEEIDGVLGIKLEDIITDFGLAEADTYLFEASDGYSVEIAREDLGSGIVYLDDNQARSLFRDMPGNTSVKKLKLIRPVQ